MYTEFYGLDRKPFALNPDSRFFWYGDKLADALDNIRKALLEEDGHVVLTGDVGTGKTILANALVKTIDDTVHVAKICNPSLDPIDFCQFVAKIYGADEEITSKDQFHAFFTEFLQNSSAEGKSVLLIIDEAQKLSEELLEEIHLLPNIEKQGRRLFKLFFIGHSEFNERLQRPRWHSLRRKISFSYELEPLSEKQTRRYVAHRLAVAGARGPFFSSDAIHLIHQFSRGYPRLVNILCDRALQEGCTRNHLQVDGAIVSKCVQEMHFFDPLPPSEKSSPSTGTLPSSSLAPQAVAEQIDEPAVGYMEAGPNGANKAARTAAESSSPAPKRRRMRRRLVPVYGLVGALTFSLLAAGVGWQMWHASQGQPVSENESDQQPPHAGMLLEEKGIPANEQQGLTTEAEETVPSPDLDNSEDPPETEMREVTVASEPQKDTAKAEGTVSPPDLDKPENPSETEKRGVRVANEPSPPPPPPAKSEVATRSSSPPPPSAVEAPRSAGMEPAPEQSPRALELAAMMVKNGNFQVAIDLLEANVPPLERQLPEYRRIYAKALSGKAYQLQTRLPEQALLLLRRSSELDPDNFKTFFSLGEMYAERKDYASAITAYRQAAALKPENAEALFKLGYLNANTGRYAAAEEAFAKVVQLEPAYLDKALLNLALMQEKQGKKEESLVNMQKAAALRPDSQKIQVYLRQLSPVEGGE